MFQWYLPRLVIYGNHSFIWQLLHWFCFTREELPPMFYYFHMNLCFLASPTELSSPKGWVLRRFRCQRGKTFALINIPELNQYLLFRIQMLYQSELMFLTKMCFPKKFHYLFRLQNASHLNMLSLSTTCNLKLSTKPSFRFLFSWEPLLPDKLKLISLPSCKQLLL